MISKKLVNVEGQVLQLSNLEKILWPKLALTKAQLLDFHVQMHDLTTKHWGERALTVTRYPHGAGDKFFFQKNLPPNSPNWLVSYVSGETEYIVPNNLATIIWLVNLASIEFHPSIYRISDPLTPSYAIIDLDPTPPSGFKETVDMAKACGELLTKLNLQGYPKLSGATGIHIYIPLAGTYGFDLSSQLVRFIGLQLQKLYPTNITLERLIKNRRGIYVDYLQNHPGKTIVGVYSPRPTPEATVSTPVRWVDLDYYEPEDFTIKTVPSWVSTHGDLFKETLANPQSLAHLEKYFSPVTP